MDGTAGEETPTGRGETVWAGAARPAARGHRTVPPRWPLVTLPVVTIVLVTVLGLAPFVDGVAGLRASPRITSGAAFGVAAGTRGLLLHRAEEKVACELRGNPPPRVLPSGRPVSWRWGAERWSSAAEFETSGSGTVTLLCAHTHQTFVLADARRLNAGSVAGSVVAGLVGAGLVLAGGVLGTVLLAMRRLRSCSEPVRS